MSVFQNWFSKSDWSVAIAQREFSMQVIKGRTPDHKFPRTDLEARSYQQAHRIQVDALRTANDYKHEELIATLERNVRNGTPIPRSCAAWVIERDCNEVSDELRAAAIEVLEVNPP
jgi:hypothetical protein